MNRKKWLTVSLLALFVSLFASQGISTTKVEASSSQWTGKLYPSKNFTGKSVSLTTTSLNYSWASKAPHKSIPAGNYSAIFEKKVVVNKDTKYILMGKANDGIRIYVDGKDN